jgi:hypothetical protein
VSSSHPSSASHPSSTRPHSPDPDWSPDPERDSAVLVEMFLAHLADQLSAGGLAPESRRTLIERIRERQRRLNTSDAAPTPPGAPAVPDAAARYNRRYTTAVLAAYQILSAAAATMPGVPDRSSLVACLTRAFVEPLGEAVAAGTRAMLDAAPDPFAAMVAVARARESEDFGAEFVFAHPVDDDHLFADVHRCGYHEYFAGQHAAELTPVLCAFDANWIGAIDPRRHGFTFNRSTTIGFGGRICPFRFQRLPAAGSAGDWRIRRW